MEMLHGLEPCPLCGREPYISDLSSTFEYGYETTYLVREGKITCVCGLSFEKNWVENPERPDLSDTDIIEEWNDLMRKLKGGDNA